MTVASSGKIALSSEREASDLKSFYLTLGTVMNDSAPDVIAMKQKPHKGAMAAGPSAIKMEALVLLCSTCKIVFVSPPRLQKVEIPNDVVFGYQHDALRAILWQKERQGA